ncbi:hypothetical protein C2G38_2267755 [Gigaspora rosea]|uniref:Uncharacterized protein n=1 Tax=Gigaspora rosea TaxID=44941 RepID=A0A397VUY5_9GLOM|nr:hypothetical protein C2G38_2267755 [Gigaspora rosea]
MESPKEKVSHEDCFMTLGFMDQDRTPVFLLLKDGFSVYCNDELLKAQNIIRSNTGVWSCFLESSQKKLTIVDNELNEVYAEVGFNDGVMEIMFNELGFRTWVTINKVKPFCNLEKNVREYLSHLKGILDEECKTESYTQEHIIERASIICDSFTILDRYSIINYAKAIVQ